MNQPLDQLKALSDRNRLRVVAALMSTDELCACHISKLLGVTGATASRHMDLLIRAELVDSRKDGRWVHYSLNPAFPEQLFQWLEKTVLTDRDVQTDRKTLKTIVGCS